ncbi:MAG: signal recognition particle-docking protein FtsY [Chloroflexi bacterium HGW-Chloroflexi-10]|nr:MAG: signal recognition particle-docking protein FtsY [Chloroflexi bacterium HGW-Chloroflexi-10]
MADLFNKWFSGLEKTRKVAFGRISNMFGATEVTVQTWDELEAMMVQADMGIETTQQIILSLMKTVDREGITRSDELREYFKKELLSRLILPQFPNLAEFHPAVIMVVGVNGSGKTTTLAKLGQKFKKQNKKILFAAADTFRAAAVDQLQVWADRLNIPVIAGQPDGDPGAVAFDAVQAGVARGMDMVFIDTAGRLHTRFNLMEELKKVDRVVRKALPGAPHATWLVLDATTGQNALMQARAFKDAVNINGVILTKLDSSAKGGMAFAIQKELNVPIFYAGLGEKPEDLQEFNPEEFVNSLLS